MQVLTIFAIYFIIWWLTFFAVLPFGVRSQIEEGDVTLGTEHGAPAKPMIVKKMLITTVIAGVITGFLFWLVAYQGFGWDDIPFLEPVRLY